MLNLPTYANTKALEALRAVRLGAELECEEDMVTPTLEQLSILDEKVGWFYIL